MIRRAQKNVIFLMTAAIVLLACAPAFASAATPIPTFDPNSISTSIVETANAAATQTSLFTTPTATPTFTSMPTKTPSETPTPTNTFLYVLYSPTASKTFTPTKQPTDDYACALMSQTPEDNSQIGAGTPFSVRWQVKNIGTITWDSGNVDYRYKNGAKMYNQLAYDLNKSIPTGEVADIVVDMTAPAKPGKYETIWVMRFGKREFCKLTLTIKVN